MDCCGSGCGFVIVDRRQWASTCTLCVGSAPLKQWEGPACGPAIGRGREKELENGSLWKRAIVFCSDAP